MQPATTTYIVLKELAGNPPPHLNLIQTLLAPYTETLVSLWMSAWIMTAVVLLIVLARAWRNRT